MFLAEPPTASACGGRLSVPPCRWLTPLSYIGYTQKCRTQMNAPRIVAESRVMFTYRQTDQCRSWKYLRSVAAQIEEKIYFARPLNPVESISIFQTAPRPATYKVLFFGPLKARPCQS